jgi:hypothetical protein
MDRFNYSFDTNELHTSDDDQYNQQEGGGFLENIVNGVTSIFTGNNQSSNENINNIKDKMSKLIESVKINGSYFIDNLDDKYLKDVLMQLDDMKQNILHKLANVDENGTFNILLEKLDKCKQLKDIVNKQDMYGNTPLHLAVKNEKDKFIVFLAKHGAQFRIKNDDGYAVVLTTEKQDNEPHNDEIVGGSDDTETFLNNLMKNQYENYYMDSADFGDHEDHKNYKDYEDDDMIGGNDNSIDTEQIINNILSKNVNNYSNMKGGNKDDNFDDTEEFLDGLVNKYNKNNMFNGGNGVHNEIAEIDTEQFLNNIINKYNSENTNNNTHMKGGSDNFINNLANQYDISMDTKDHYIDNNNKNKNTFLKSVLRRNENVESPYTYTQNDLTTEYGNIQEEHNSESYNTETFINNVLGKLNGKTEMSGGKSMSTKKSVIGKRKITQYDDMQTSRDGELNRIIRNKEKEIHKKVKSTISKLIGGNEEKTNKIKTKLWKYVKDKYPKLVSDLDKSLQLQRLATKENIKNIAKNKPISESSTSSSSRSSRDNSRSSGDTSSAFNSQLDNKFSATSDNKNTSSDMKGGNYLQNRKYNNRNFSPTSSFNVDDDNFSPTSDYKTSMNGGNYSPTSDYKTSSFNMNGGDYSPTSDYKTSSFNMNGGDYSPTSDIDLETPTSDINYESPTSEMLF